MRVIIYTVILVFLFSCDNRKKITFIAEESYNIDIGSSIKHYGVEIGEVKAINFVKNGNNNLEIIGLINRDINLTEDAYSEPFADILGECSINVVNGTLKKKRENLMNIPLGTRKENSLMNNLIDKLEKSIIHGVESFDNKIDSIQVKINKILDSL